jgi:hypothetical protein
MSTDGVFASTRRHGILVFIVLCLAWAGLVAVLVRQQGFLQAGATLGVPVVDLPFIDMRQATDGIAAAAAGQDVINGYYTTRDLYPMRFPYHRSWLLFRYLGVRGSHTAVLAVLLGLGLLAHFMVMIVIAGNRATTGAVLAAFACSPPVLLGLERGNPDLLLYLLVAAACHLWATRSLALQGTGMVLLLAAGALKFFPFAGALGVLSGADARRRGWLLAGGVAAAVLFVLLLAPSPEVRADQTLREAEQALLLPVERGYVVEVRRAKDDPDDTLSTRRMRVWTHGDRFRVEVDQDNDRWSWGRDLDGSVWVVVTPQRGLKINPDEIGPALQRLCDRYGLQPKTLLNDMLTGADLNQRPGDPNRKTVIVRGQFRTGFHRQWLESTELELDATTKVIQKFTVNRAGPGGEQETLTFTLNDTRPLDESLYRLEGNLTPPFEVLDRDSRPGRRRMILGTRLGGGNHRWLITGNKP